jgi:hypothetical protein
MRPDVTTNEIDELTNLRIDEFIDEFESQCPNQFVNS